MLHSIRDWFLYHNVHNLKFISSSNFYTFLWSYNASMWYQNDWFSSCEENVRHTKFACKIKRPTIWWELRLWIAQSYRKWSKGWHHLLHLFKNGKSIRVPDTCVDCTGKWLSGQIFFRYPTSHGMFLIFRSMFQWMILIFLGAGWFGLPSLFFLPVHILLQSI